MRWLAALGAAALGAVGLLTGCTPAPPPLDAAQARCQQQAEDDPAVRDLRVQQPTRPGDPLLEQRLEQARHKAVNDCLVASGAPVRGGVEPVSQAHFGFGSY